MAIIALRAYNHEIEGMIDNGQLDEAVAHCRYILATFPKYIASYRLLGKAHLEQQRISDATDIFQRVLSSIPDDFIANVGMSIIREDENNLDSSIWHMELAFEAQPSNAAIQDELRRLYGRRDGTQPIKPRTTRGALARMYAKGGLTDQAIAELRAAITEEPNRPDLQLLLAEMYFQTSQRVEAVETCANIIKKLPFCLEANRILAVSLPGAEESETVRNYRQIVISMDPYYAFAGPEAISSDDVPENAVNIERLDYKSGIQVTDTPIQPNWATSLGISIEKPSDDNIPEWLKSAEAPAPTSNIEKTGGNVSPFIFDSQEVAKIITDTSKPETEIPDWMKDAGWQPATGEAAPPPAEIQPEEVVGEAQAKESLEKAEIPDWLQGIAPEGALGEAKPIEAPQESTLSTPWLEQHEPGPTDSIINWLEDNQPEKPRSRATKEETVSELPEDEVPDWLKDLEPAQTAPAPSTPTADTPASSTAFTIEPSAFIGGSPLPETPDGTAAPIGAPTRQAEQPAQTGSAVSGQTPLEPGREANEEIPDWLRELAGEPISEAELPAQEGTPVETVQSGETFTNEGAPSATEQAPITETVPEAALQEAEPVAGIELPEMELTASPEEPAAIEMLQEVETPLVEEIPSVTKGLAGESIPAASEALSADQKPAVANEPPADDIVFGEVPPVDEHLAEESPEAELPLAGETPAAVEATLSDEIPAWLEELAAAQTPEDIEQAPATELPSEPVDSSAAAAVPAEELSAWMQEPSTTEPEEASEEVPATEVPTAAEMPADAEALPAEELPAWTQEPSTTGPAEAAVEEPAMEAPIIADVPAVPEAMPAEELPAWMQGLSIQELSALVEEETTQVEPAKENIPAIAEEVPTEIVQPPAEEPLAIDATKTEDLPSWLGEVPAAEATATSSEQSIADQPVEPSELPAQEPSAAHEEMSANVQPAAQRDAFEIVAPEPGVPGELEAFAWLEGLAAEQSAKAEAVPTPQETGEILPPEWVKMEAEPPVDEVPEAEIKTPEAKTVPTEEVPDWIKGLGDEPGNVPVQAEAEVTSAPEPELTQAEELPAWLRELEEPEPEKNEAVPADEELEWKAEELPAWLKEISDAETPQEAPTPAAHPALVESALPHEPPASEEAPTGEVQPAEEALPAMDVPIAEEAIAENVPPVEETPVAEEAEGEAAIAHEVPVIEEIPAAQETPIAEGAITAEKAAMTEEVPVIEEVPGTQEGPVAEEAVAAEEVAIAQEVPVIEGVPTAEIPEPAAQWSDEVTPPAGIKLEALAEPPVDIGPWVPEAEEPVPAVPPVEPVPPTTMSEELETQPVKEEAPAEDHFELFQAVSKANQADLSDARNAVGLGDPAKIVELYNKLIQQNYHLDEIIKDLKEALYRFPVDANLWVSLGAAHFRSDDLQEALNAYNKADELVR